MLGGASASPAAAVTAARTELPSPNLYDLPGTP